MTRKSVLKITVLAVLAIFLLLLTFTALPIVQKEGTATKLYLGAGDNEPQLLEDFSAIQNNYYPCGFMLDGSEYSLDSTDGKWESKTLFGDSALYFGLNATASANYSAQATITTPQLILADNTYILTLDYFSSRESDFPNSLTVSSSIDGNKFIKHTTETAFFIDNAYNTISIELPYNTKYISIYAKVYADDGRTNSGIYIDNIGLTAVNSHDLTDATFTATLDEDTFIYDGSAKTPTYNIECSLEAPYVPYVFVSASNILNYREHIDAINVGDYYLHIAIFNICNEQVDAIVLPFTIEKSALTLDIDDLQYCVYEAFLFVFNLPLLNESGDYVTLFNNEGLTYTITKDGVDTTSHDNVTRLFFDGEFNLRITIDESANYYGVVSDSITIGQTRFDGIYLNIISTSSIYTGRVEGLSHYLYVPLYEDEPYNLNATRVVYDEEDFSIIYTMDGVEVEPIKVGKYIATINYKEMVWHINYEITKSEVKHAFYWGSYSLDKTYDGSNMLYYTYKENKDDTETVTSVASTFKPHEFMVPQINSEDDATLLIGSANFNYTYGKVKLLFNDISIVGSDASNYAVASDFSCSLEGAIFNITPSTLSLAPHSDGSNTLLIKEKAYDGTLDAEINYDELENIYGELRFVPLKFYGLSGSDKLDISKLDAKFISKYAGQREVSLSHNDFMLLDRYTANIDMHSLTTPLKATINPIDLDIDTSLSSISVTNKVYSGNNSATVSIGSCYFNTPLVEDSATLNGTNDIYTIVYGNATYSQIGAGQNLDITVSNINMALLDIAYKDIIGSYIINDLTLKGDIDKKQLSLLTEHLRISSGTIIPELLFEPSGIDISMSFYNSLPDAESMTNSLSSDPSTDGNYYIRVTCSDVNYYIDGGYDIVSLVITNLKTDQTIVFDDLSSYIVGETITLIKGGKFLPVAHSINDLGEKTSLNITYSISGSSSLYSFEDAILTALGAGTINIIAAQSGDAFYNPASASITVNIVNYSIDLAMVSVDDTAFVGEELPTLSGNALVNMASVNSSFVAIDNIIELDKTLYNYKLSFDNTYVGYYEVHYELNPELFTLIIHLPTEITKSYYQDINFLDYITLQVQTSDGYSSPPLSQYSSFGLNFTPSFDQNDLLPDTYLLSVDELDPYYIFITTNKNYQLNIIGTNINLIVVKSKVRVLVPAVTKSYGQQSVQPSADTVVFDGIYNSSHLISFRDSILFNLSSNMLSPVGSYIINTSFNFEDTEIGSLYDFEIVSTYEVVMPTPITITTTAPTSEYGTTIADYDIVISGLYLPSDEIYFKNYITTTLIGATISSNVGTYTILVDYNGVDSNYLPTVVNGVYTITPAPFRGINLADKKYLYDNKKHSLELTFNEPIEDIVIVYNILDATEVGVYTITATVSKSNYITTMYSAKLTIATLKIVSSNLTTKTELIDKTEGSTGFSPDLTLALKTSDVVGIELAVKEKLKSLPTLQENIVAIYDLSLLQDNMPVVLPSGRYRIRLSLPSVPTDKNIRILATLDDELVEVEYTFENGYFTFDTDSIYGIAILKTTQITESRISTIIVASIVGIIVIGMFYLIISGFAGHKQAKIKSRKNHHKWS